MTSEDFDSELDTLQYFWKAKGDLRRYTGWDVLHAELAARRPDILKAWNDYKAAEMILTAVLEHRE
jgi:hypothetical protein